MTVLLVHACQLNFNCFSPKNIELILNNYVDVLIVEESADVVKLLKKIICFIEKLNAFDIKGLSLGRNFVCLMLILFLRLCTSKKCIPVV